MATVASAPANRPGSLLRAAPLVNSSTAATTNTSTMLCLISAAIAPAAPAARLNRNPLDLVAARRGRDVRQDPGDHERQPQQLAVDHRCTEQRRGDADGRRTGGEQGSGPPLRRGDPAEHAGEDHREDRRERPDQPQRHRPAQRVGRLEDRDQHRRPVHPVVAVQAAALGPLPADDEVAGLVRAQRAPGERQPGRGRRRPPWRSPSSWARSRSGAATEWAASWRRQPSPPPTQHGRKATQRSADGCHQRLVRAFDVAGPGRVSRTAWGRACDRVASRSA